MIAASRRWPSRFADEPQAALPAEAPRGVELLVVGAHRSGQPLNHQLTAIGGRLVGIVTTSADVSDVCARDRSTKARAPTSGCRAAPIEGELWELPSGALGPFLAALPPPMTLGQVRLADGRSVVGFGCEATAL